MERQNRDAALNGRRGTALEEKPLELEKSIEFPETSSTEVAPTEPETAATEVGDREPEADTKLVAPPKRKRPIKMILGILGALAVSAGGYYGYQYWQYASSHEETENATVAGHIHQVSTRIPGTIAEVLISENQWVNKGDVLVRLDPGDYEVKVQQAQAALETARQQAEAAQANIALAQETTAAQTTQAQGDVTGAIAGISTARAAVEEAESGVPAAQAALAQAEAGIPAAEAAVREAEAGIPAAQAQLQQAEATLEQAETDYNRYQSLFDAGAISGQQLGSAKAAYQVALGQRNAAQQGIEQAQAKVDRAREGVTQAQAQVARARQDVARAQAQLAQAQEGVATAQAQLEASQGGLQQASASGQQTEVNRSQYEAAKAAMAQAEAALKDAQLQLSYTNIVAPASGRVGRKSVEIGQRVQPGTPLFAIVSNEHWVVANFKETQLEEMKPGQPVEIKLDAFPHHTFEGRLESVSPASGSQFALLPPDNATGNFTKIVQRVPVKIVFDANSIQGYESRIVPGMSAVVEVNLKASENGQ